MFFASRLRPWYLIGSWTYSPPEKKIVIILLGVNYTFSRQHDATKFKEV